MDDNEMFKTVYHFAIIVERYFIKILAQVSDGKMCINIPVGIGTLLSISW